jgi:hypothetical protein
VEEAANSAAARHPQAFLEEFDFIQMEPDTSIIREVQPELTASALVKPGEAYAMYFHAPLPNKPDPLSEYLRRDVSARVTLELPANLYRVQWLNTLTGDVAGEQLLEHGGGDVVLESPSFDNDIALRVTRVRL